MLCALNGYYCMAILHSVNCTLIFEQNCLHGMADELAQSLKACNSTRTCANGNAERKLSNLVQVRID